LRQALSGKVDKLQFLDERKLRLASRGRQGAVGMVIP
jgi:hypothetical protein